MNEEEERMSPSEYHNEEYIADVDQFGYPDEDMMDYYDGDEYSEGLE